MKKTLILASIAALAALVSSCGARSCGNSPYEKEIAKMLGKMTLEQKAGQMVQINIDKICDPATGVPDSAALEDVIAVHKVGSILNTLGWCPDREWMSRTVKAIQDKSMQAIGIPCIYGLDMIHGATYLKDGTFFPQEINLGATFNPSYAAAMGRITAYETRSMQVPWVFSPVMDLGRDPRWSRQWESWGEDAYLQSVMSLAETCAMQGTAPDDKGCPAQIGLENVAVSLKHFMAYGVPFSGKDRTPAWVPDFELRERYFRPFKACIEAGALTIMVNSSSINGIPTHMNRKLLTLWVKEELGWDGMIVTDWRDIDALFTRDHVAADRKEAVAKGINAGIDMIMDPYDADVADDICALAREGIIPMSRIDDAVARVLRLKFRLGLFEGPVWEHDYPLAGSEEFAAEALAAAVESEVLLKNEGGLLPLRPDTRILLTGPAADHMRPISGGWSYTWQGSDEQQYVGRFNTVYEALKARFPNTRLVPGVEYKYDGQWWEDYDAGISKAVSEARNADVVIACIGENSYCETPGNLTDLTLSANQRKMVKALAATGKKIVLVLFEGRPRVISEIEPLATAVVDAMLPSNYGADALALLLSGEENFSGRLPLTYPKHVNSLHTYDYKVCENRATIAGAYNYDAVMDVQWPFGSGLSYTSFEYSGFSVSPACFTADDEIEATVTVRNAGTRPGKETVMLFSSDVVARIIPDVRRLRAFTKLDLGPGEERTVTLKLPARELAFAAEDGRWYLEEGDFRISLQGSGSSFCPSQEGSPATPSCIIRCTKTETR